MFLVAPTAPAPRRDADRVTNVWPAVLSEHQRAIAERVIAEESARREHVVVYLSGAHAYGFPSPDSDLDLKAIHVAATPEILGLSPPRMSFDRAEVIEGVEIDYTSNELAPALAGMLRGNGNYLERVLGASTLASSELHRALRDLAPRALSRQVHRHYRGFAESQLRELERAPTVKRLLYVLRTAASGTHLLRTGEMVTDLAVLAAGCSELEGVGDLIARKRAGERAPLGVDDRERWRARVEWVLAALDSARERSPLPEEPPGRADFDAFLIAARRARL